MKKPSCKEEIAFLLHALRQYLVALRDQKHGVFQFRDHLKSILVAEWVEDPLRWMAAAKKTPAVIFLIKRHFVDWKFYLMGTGPMQTHQEDGKALAMEHCAEVLDFFEACLHSSHMAFLPTMLHHIEHRFATGEGFGLDVSFLPSDQAAFFLSLGHKENRRYVANALIQADKKEATILGVLA